MNREIKFRVWDKNKKCFLTRAFSIFDDMDSCLPFDFTKHIGEGYIMQQFTGINDHEGVPIYEGDILEFKYGGKFARGKSSPVIWASCLGGNDWSGWYCQAAGYSGRYEEGKVIGNIFETPELLK